MKINHPQVTVEVYVDGRYEIHAPAKVSNYREAFAVAALQNLIPAMIHEAGDKLEPGYYEVHTLGFKLRTRKFQFELNPVQ